MISMGRGYLVVPMRDFLTIFAMVQRLKILNWIQLS